MSKCPEIVTGDRIADATVILDAIEERTFKGRGREFARMWSTLMRDVVRFANAARPSTRRVSMRRAWHKRGIIWTYAGGEANLVCLICQESIVTWGRQSTHVTQAIYDRLDIHTAGCAARYVLARFSKLVEERPNAQP